MVTQQRQITLGTTYYNNPDYLKTFVKTNIDHVDELIIVDDGSSDPATNHVHPHDKIKLYRVSQDYGFNSHGCRNLIMKESSNDWVVMLDVDRQFIDPEFAFSTLRTKKLQKNVRYCFEAYHVTLDNLHMSVNDFMIHRDHFFSAGGYDEELLGWRGGDRLFFKQLLHFGPEMMIRGVILELTRKSSALLKQEGHDYVISPNEIKSLSPEITSKVNRRITHPEPTKPIITFDWERVF